MDKISTYIGFAIKSGNFLRGTDAVKMYKKRIFLIILCKNAAFNTQKDITDFASYRKIPLIITTDFTLEEITGKENCKVIGIIDKNLAQAIIQNNT